MHLLLTLSANKLRSLHCNCMTIQLCCTFGWLLHCALSILANLLCAGLSEIQRIKLISSNNDNDNVNGIVIMKTFLHIYIHKFLSSFYAVRCYTHCNIYPNATFSFFLPFVSTSEFLPIHKFFNAFNARALCSLTLGRFYSLCIVSHFCFFFRSTIHFDYIHIDFLSSYNTEHHIRFTWCFFFGGGEWVKTDYMKMCWLLLLFFCFNMMHFTCLFSPTNLSWDTFGPSLIQHRRWCCLLFSSLAQLFGTWI